MTKTTRRKTTKPRKEFIDPFTFGLPQTDLHGETTLTCNAEIESFLKDCIHLKHKKGIIIHGKGTGALKAATHAYLKKSKYVSKYYLDAGNIGQTIVELKDFK